MADRVARLLCLALLLLGLTAAVAADRQYTVREGDTLYGISRKLQVPAAVLQAFNGIKDPTRLKPATVLEVPSAHEVRKGDTLYAIARQSGVALEALLDLNGLKASDPIKPGDRIWLPAGARPQPSTTATASSTDGTLWPLPGTRTAYRGRIEGVVISGSRGDTVRSVTDGEVKWTGPYWNFGKTLIVRAPDGHLLLYAGNEELLVRVGDRVSRGMEIARLGLSPQGGGARLYFSVHGRTLEYVDPEKYLANS